MIPQAKLRLSSHLLEDGQNTVEQIIELTWFDYHPGDDLEQFILMYVTKRAEEILSDIVVFSNKLIYIKWQNENGVVVIMTAMEDDIFKIGLDTYQWSQYVSRYASMTDLGQVTITDSQDTAITEIPKQIKRDWFDVAIQGGMIKLNRHSENYHIDLANVFGYFPWIIYFLHDGKVTDDTVLEITRSGEHDIDVDAIFEQIDSDLNEPFWLLIYQLTEHLANIKKGERDQTCYRYLQASYDLTKDNTTYHQKLDTIFRYEDIIPVVDVNVISNNVQNILFAASSQPSTSAICDELLELATLLIDQNFTDLGKLAEATTLEHALKLKRLEDKYEIILELTKRSTVWGDQHLISFIQTLTGLLSDTDEDQKLLSEAINLITPQLEQSWDGTLCLVEGKLRSNQIGDAIRLRFVATEKIRDRVSRSEEIFAAIIWALQYDLPADELLEIAQSYLEFALDTFPSEVCIKQIDVLVQKTLQSQKFAFLQLFFHYLRDKLQYITVNSYPELVSQLEQLLTSTKTYPQVYLEFLLLHLDTLKYQDQLNTEDRQFQLLGQIFNNINPTTQEAGGTLRYISGQLINFGTSIGDLAFVEETARRYLLMTKEKTEAQNHLKKVYFQVALEHSKLPSSELESNDIGLQLFNKGMELIEISTDYELIRRLLPHMKQLAMKSRTYTALIDVILTEIRIKKLQGDEWIDDLLKDIEQLLRKGRADNVKTILFETHDLLDLSTQELRRLIQAELELVELEPDLFSAEEIYDKRMELIGINSTDENDQEFIIKNYQQGISELMSKADSTNLTNLLFDAINYSISTNAEELTEFTELLFDNFTNIIVDYQEQDQPQLYKYLLTMWRKVINIYGNRDLRVVIDFTNRLYQLNLQRSNQDKIESMERAHLIMKEMAIVIDRSDIPLAMLIKDQLINEYQPILSYVREKHRDFGIITAVREYARFCSNLDDRTSFLPLLDECIASLKQEIIHDSSAASTVVLIIYQLCELGQDLDVLQNELLLTEISNRIERLINFSLSLDLEEDIKDQIREIGSQHHYSPSTFIQEFPTNLTNYFNS